MKHRIPKTRATLGVATALALMTWVAGATLVVQPAAAGGRAKVTRSGSSSGSKATSSAARASSSSSTRTVVSRGSSSGRSAASTRSVRVHTRPSHFRHGGWNGYWGIGYYGGYGSAYWNPFWGWGYYAPYYPYYAYPPVVAYSSSPGYGMGALDFAVQPKQAEVFVNGQFVGLAKQYDGFPGYLWLDRGSYEIAVYHPGYQTVTKQIQILTGLVLDFPVAMTPGEATMPQAAQTARPSGYDATMSSSAQGSAAVSTEPVEQTAHCRVRVEPVDASVYLDGRFVGTGDELAARRSGLSVAAGDHLLEVVRPGYQSRKVEFRAEAGEELELQVELDG